MVRLKMLLVKYRSISFLLAMMLLFYTKHGSSQVSEGTRTEKDIALLEFVSPDYPALARAAVLEGTFELQAEISAYGKISRVNRVNATLNVNKAKAADLFWEYIDRELRESWRFSVPNDLSSEFLVPIELVFVLDEVSDRSNCNRTRVEVKLRPFLKLVIHGVKPHPQGGLRLCGPGLDYGNSSRGDVDTHQRCKKQWVSTSSRSSSKKCYWAQFLLFFKAETPNLFEFLGASPVTCGMP